MKNFGMIFILLLIVLLFSCTQQSSNEFAIADANSDSNKAYNAKNIIDSILLVIPMVDISTFKLTVESDDNIDSDLIKLDSNMVSFFYSSAEQKKFIEEYGFSSYFLGRLPKKHNLTQILIIKSDFSSSIYMDCFFLNDDNHIKGYFNTCYLEIQPNYLMSGRGQFLNDSVYKLIEVSYEAIDDNNEFFVRDSSITKISIDYLGSISKAIKHFEKDTVQ